MSVWPFLIYLLYVILVEVFINIRISRLEHAVRILILTEVRNQDKANELIVQYSSIPFLKLLKPLATGAPKFITKALEQMRRAAGLRLFLHAVGIIAIFLVAVIL